MRQTSTFAFLMKGSLGGLLIFCCLVALLTQSCASESKMTAQGTLRQRSRAENVALNRHYNTLQYPAQSRR